MTSFDLETFLRQPRLAGLACSPDGRQLAVGVSTPAPDGKRFRTALWAVDPAGEDPPRQLTRSAPGESGAAYTADGALLFVSARPDPDAEKTPTASRLPRCGRCPGTAARRSCSSPPRRRQRGHGRPRRADRGRRRGHPSRADRFDADRERADARDEAGVAAQLFTDYPIRFWDDYLGPARTLPLGAARGRRPAARRQGRHPPQHGGRPHPRRAHLRDLLAALGRVTGRRRPDDLVADLVAIDVETGDRRVVVADGRWFASPAVSPTAPG
jgi:hypothetical protein